MTTNLPGHKAAKSLAQLKNRARPTENGIQRPDSAPTSFLARWPEVLTLGEHTLLFASVLFPTVVRFLMPLPLWVACQGLPCPVSSDPFPPPSLRGSSVLPSPMPPAEVWLLFTLNLGPPGPAPPSTQCLSAFSLLHRCSPPSCSPNTCSLKETQATKEHVTSLFLLSSFWGGSKGT